MNSHDGGDAAQRLRCTHLSFDYARGKYPERVQEDHSISRGVLAEGRGCRFAAAIEGEDEGASRLLDSSTTLVLAVLAVSPIYPSPDFLQERQRPALVRRRDRVRPRRRNRRGKARRSHSQGGRRGGCTRRGRRRACCRGARPRRRSRRRCSPSSRSGSRRGRARAGSAPPDRASPGAEVFGGERLPGNLLQVGVDILGADGVGLAVRAEVLEEMLTGKVLHPRDDCAPRGDRGRRSHASCRSCREK